MRCGYCADNVSFIDLEEFKNHMVENHPESEIAKQQSTGLEAVGLFAPDLSPVVLIRNGDTPIVSMLAPDAMRLGYMMLMQGRQTYDDWCLIRVLESNNIPEETGFKILKELRDKRSGD